MSQSRQDEFKLKAQAYLSDLETAELAFDGYVGMKLWNWFMVLQFNLQPIGFFMAEALLLTAFFFANKGSELAVPIPENFSESSTLCNSGHKKGRWKW